MAPLTSQEWDVTKCVLKLPENEEEEAEHLMHTELLTGQHAMDESNISSLKSIGPSHKIHYLIRIPVGGHFYKLFFYACPKDADPQDPIPLVYTYLIEAPTRITSAEMPYVGVLGGPFPEKLVDMSPTS